MTLSTLAPAGAVVLAALATDPRMTEEVMINMLNSCMHQPNPAAVTPGAIREYCACTAYLLSRLVTEEEVRASEKGDFSPGLQAKMMDVMKVCIMRSIK